LDGVTTEHIRDNVVDAFNVADFRPVFFDNKTPTTNAIGGKV